MRGQRFVLHLLVLAGGAATMSVEMCASRLLAPHFGNSLPVWGLLIGLLLAYLAVGYTLGGRLADRTPLTSLLYQLAGWAGFLIGLIPVVSLPILRYSARGFAGYEAGPVLGALLAVLVLFAAPVVLLGCISPFAVRLSVRESGSAGSVAGRVYALSTLGSLLGTFVPVFLLIPTWGTRRSILGTSLMLLIVAIAGLWQVARRRALWYMLLLALVVGLCLLPPGEIKAAQGLVYERDSAYNYIQVLHNDDEWVLKLNEGEGIQSAYASRQVLTGYVYDYFLLAPLFRAELRSLPVDNLCLIGLAAGTMARQYSAVFGPLPIDGVEIDPAVVEAGQRFMGLDLPNLRVIVEDGRYFLAHTEARYDVIIVDAYRPPYIPFQLTTVEFFQQVHDHLTQDGVVAVNVARTEEDRTLVDAIASTLKAVYPSVYVMDTQGDVNSIVLATRQPTRLAVALERIAGASDPLLRAVGGRAQGRIQEYESIQRKVLTDDCAPIEHIVHAMVARYLLRQNASEVNP